MQKRCPYAGMFMVTYILGVCIYIYVGYAFILFRDEVAVHHLVKNCLSEDSKFYTFVSSVTQTNKKVTNNGESDCSFIIFNTACTFHDSTLHGSHHYSVI